MQRRTRVCVFSDQPSYEEQFADALNRIRWLEVVALVSTWEGLHEFILRDQVDVVIVNLGDDPDDGINVVKNILEIVPDVGIVGVSRSANPQTIISAMRAGCAQFVSSPVDAEDLANALDRIRQTHLGVPHKSRRVCLIGSSGGVGCTTIACNLALELAYLTNRRTGLVDLNLEFGDVACAFDCEPKFSIADICSGGSNVDRTMLESALHELPCDIAILARPNDVNEARTVTPEGVEQALAVMGTMFPNVVVDLPRSSSFLSIAALHGADLVLIVTQLNVPGIRNATRVYDVLCNMGALEDRIHIVLSRIKADYERIKPEDVEAHFNRPVFAMIPNDYRQVMSALNLGQPIFDKAPTSSARLAIHQMAKKIATECQTSDPEKDARRSLFGRLLSKK
ncbi:MAG: response regulator [Phycisphaerales bacterium]|nr:MAG: response regulator [Phycisphaerales bacterium]